MKVLNRKIQDLLPYVASGPNPLKPHHYWLSYLETRIYFNINRLSKILQNRRKKLQHNSDVRLY